MEIATKLTSIFDEDAQDLVSEYKEYPIYSHNSEPIVSERIAKELQQIFFQHKLNRYYACIQKAKIVANRLGIGDIHLGELMVESTEKDVSYGYKYNPPLELHAWIQLQDKIIDFALAGTIENGLKTKDAVGYFLVGREPIILAGDAPPWLHYKTHEIVPVNSINVMSFEKAKELINKIWKT